MGINSQTATQYIYSGAGVVCWRFNQQPLVASGLSAWSFRQAGTNIESIEEGGNERGAMAFIYPRGGFAAVPAVIPPANVGEPNYDRQLPFVGSYTQQESPNWSPDLCEWNEDITTTIGEGGPFGQYVRRNVYQYAFSDVGTAGAVTGTSNVDERDTRGLGTGGEAIKREVASWSLAWQRDVLTCEIGGPDQLQREPGCSNCGDRAKLEPFV